MLVGSESDVNVGEDQVRERADGARVSGAHAHGSGAVTAWLQRLGLAVAASVLALALGEAMVRLLAGPPPMVHIETRAEPDRFDHSELKLERVPDAGGLYMTSRYGLRLRPNTHAVLNHERLSGRTIDIRTNSLGYRGPGVSSRPGTRILFLGDSITFANDLAEEETFVHLVGELGAEMGRSWNTINTGIGTIGLANELAILKETGLSVHPDVVVLDFYLNDFQESPGVFMLMPPPQLAWSSAARWAALLLGRWEHRQEQDAAFDAIIERQLAMRLERGPGDWRESERAFSQIVFDWRGDWGGAWSDHVWELMQPLLVELKRLSDVHRFTLVFVALPVSYQVEARFVDDRPQRRLVQIGRELGVPVLDLLPPLRAATSQGTLFYDQCHHTVLGSRVVARAVADFLGATVPDC